MKNFPEGTLIEPNLSPETYTNRIRDSVKALFRAGWDVCFDLEMLRQIWPAVVVCGLPDGRIRIGKRQPRGLGSASHGQSVEPRFFRGEFIAHVKNPEADILEALFLLYDREALVPPTRLSGVPREKIQELLVRYKNMGIRKIDEDVLEIC